MKNEYILDISTSVDKQETVTIGSKIMKVHEVVCYS